MNIILKRFENIFILWARMFSILNGNNNLVTNKLNIVSTINHQLNNY